MRNPAAAIAVRSARLPFFWIKRATVATPSRIDGLLSTIGRWHCLRIALHHVKRRMTTPLPDLLERNRDRELHRQ
jgi:hypothetical protein